jgi:hypothetical protein
MKYLFFLFIGLFTISCAPSFKRIGYRDTPAEDPKMVPQILYNAAGLDSTGKLGTLIIYDNGFCMGFSREKAVEKIITEASDIGAKAANLYNIKEPSFFTSNCYQTYVDFYSDTIADRNNYLSYEDAVNFIDSTLNQGTHISFAGIMGFVNGGNQKKTGLHPEPETISKNGFGFRGTYMLNESFGLDAGWDYLLTNANKKDYASLTLFNEIIFRSGARYAILNNYSPFNLFHLDLQAGLNYDRLKLDQDLIDLLEEASGGLFVPYPGSATGLGWYSGLSFQFHTKSKMYGSLGIEYDVLNPKFSQASTPIDAKTLLFNVNIGYNF